LNGLQNVDAIHMMIVFYITLFLLFGYGWLMEYYRRAWNQIPGWTPPALDRIAPGTRISVIIPARNEEDNIGACIQSILQQTYPKDLLEIIVVNDHSSDQTTEIVNGFGSPQIRLLNLEEYIPEGKSRSHKKKAIEIAVTAASGTLIITTDADCRAPSQWISAMEDYYVSKKAVFIAAPVRISGNGSLLSVFQSLDFITLQGITGASVFKHLYSMCNGANLGYEKKAFAEVEGFKGIDAVASGDDMLLMHKIERKFPLRTFFLKTREAIVETGPVQSWGHFLQQRIRWSSKADKYDDKKIFFTLLFVYLLNLGLLVLLVASFWNIAWLYLFGILTGIKTVLEFSFVRKVAIFFEQGHLMKYFPFLQPLHIVYIVMAGLLGKIMPYRWKDRTIGS
jgi:cellulose synthase/poly-beta-1,6-N-acetylglucosamine synthase-like glycosyltransferase